MQQGEDLLPRIPALKAAHPCWGDRRLGAYVHFGAPLPGKKTRRWRRMRAHHLRVPPQLRLQARRTPPHRQPRPTKPNAWWGIDRTKALVRECGWGYRVIILDW